MRRFLVLFTIALASTLPSRSQTKITVQQLDSRLADMHKQSKTDDQVANALKEMELTEQLLPSVMNSFVQYQPGPQTVVQIRVLALSSALLPPPPADLPDTPAPDRATQAAIIARATDYAAKQYALLPKLTLDKTTLRYQNGEEFVRASNGAGSKMGHSDLGLDPASLYLRFLGQSSAAIVTQGGAEVLPAKAKNQDPGGPNGQISSVGTGPVLSSVLREAGPGKMTWLRWETIDGKRVAVFSFAVNRKQSHYQVNYCCFPKTENVGSHIGMSPNGVSSGGTPPTSENLGTATFFEPFNSTVGYHGEVFVDPESGTVVRLIVRAELKPTDFILQEDTRIDYGTVEAGGKAYVVPTRDILLTTMAPGGNSFAKFTTRRTLFDVGYSNYQAVSKVDSQPSAVIAPPSVQAASRAVSSSRSPQKTSDVNATIVAARAATKDTHYADAEALMLQVTSSRPELIVPWVELGLAQLGLKKYPEAEKSFETAIGTDPSTPSAGHSADTYQQPAVADAVNGASTRVSRDMATHTQRITEQRQPDVLGTAYASLGEIYIHEGKFVEAQSAFDKAAQSNPTREGAYRESEAIFFYQVGDADAQLAAAEKAIAAEPTRAQPYFFKAQALVSKATVDPQTQKIVLPSSCADAYRKYLQLEPKGQFAADAQAILATAAPQPK
ncbi:tetratricopeptide repeat protein [Alloacidobacterium sp.]|uniref:tetratricopeptide repeat protein n=1 Tax=Alloacidobacterium sp. TaxID=2951999 RepID=UPI002D2C05CF|nr:tetratricopeptide repeat protein [Alloacidobacterium sp.]HYK35800.1 tetratricopeptide repeat protein [Alloacidobacterium sp.]